MFGCNTQNRKPGVFAGCTKEARKRDGVRGSIRSFFILGCFFLRPAFSLGATPLQNSISSVTAQTSNLQSKVSTLSQDETALIQRYHLTNAGQCSLWVTSVSTGPIVVNFIPSASTISAVQADLTISSSFTITGATIGSAGTQAGKSVQFSRVGTAWRVLVFGLNTTPIGSGTLVSLSFTSATGTPPGFYPITLTNMSASDPNGNSSLLCGTSGFVKL